MTLKFNEQVHKYWLDGRPVPGVTSLIKGGYPAPALTYWAAKTVAEWVADNEDEVDRLRGMGRGPMVAALKETPWAQRDAAANRGTEVHALAEKLIAGEPVETPEEIIGHVESCARFLDLWRPEPVLVEVSIAHRAHWWAGRLDFLATLPDGRTVLFDWKTSRSGIFAETAFQLAAYSHAEFYAPDLDTEKPLPHIDACAAVWVRADGFDVIPVDASDATYSTFRHIAWVANVAKIAKAALVGAAIEPTPEGSAP